MGVFRPQGCEAFGLLRRVLRSEFQVDQLLVLVLQVAECFGAPFHSVIRSRFEGR